MQTFSSLPAKICGNDTLCRLHHISSIRNFQHGYCPIALTQRSKRDPILLFLNSLMAIGNFICMTDASAVVKSYKHPILTVTVVRPFMSCEFGKPMHQKVDKCANAWMCQFSRRRSFHSPNHKLTTKIWRRRQIKELSGQLLSQIDEGPQNFKNRWSLKMFDFNPY